MNVETMSLFFALLALGALALAVVAVALRFAGRGPRWAPWRRDLAAAALPVAWVVALVTTGGSLYYSEVANFTPCVLCWYQRIVAYPLALVLGIATFRRDRSVRPYVIAVCAVGVVISTYHSWLQAFPPSGGSSFCTLEAPCTARHVWELGFVSLPFMALCSFLCTIALMLAAGPAPSPGAGNHEAVDDDLVGDAASPTFAAPAPRPTAEAP